MADMPSNKETKTHTLYIIYNCNVEDHFESILIAQGGLMVLNVLYNGVHLKQDDNLAHCATNWFQWALRYPCAIGQWLA